MNNASTLGEAPDQLAPTDVLGRQARRVAIVTGVGAMIDYYDITVTGALSATIWPILFFPSGSFAAAFATSAGVTFGMTLLARPFGAAIFGHFGDRIGRKKTLIATLILAGIGTLGMAFAPTYHTAGSFGIILIICCRVLFGLSMGGEMGGAISWTSESAEASRTKRRGLFSGTLGIFSGVGVMVGAAFVLIISNIMPAASYQSWGWRVLLFIATLILVIGGVARYWVNESPLFKDVKAKRDAAEVRKVPIVELLASQWRTVIIMSFIAVAGTVIVSLNTTFLAGYLKAAEVPFYSQNYFYMAMFIGGIGLTAVAAMAAHFADVYGRRPTLLVTIIAAGVIGPIGLLLLLPSKDMVLIMLAAFLFELPVGGQGAFFSLYAESFPTVYRQTGAGLTYQLSNLWEGLIFVELLPVIYKHYGILGSVGPIAIICVVAAILALLALWYARETRGRALESGLTPAEVSLANPS